jgi:uncharacterized protein YidB (DUF937 family)
MVRRVAQETDMGKTSMPSFAALLGLLAIAGYQNRDRIAEVLKSVTGGGAAPGGVAKSITDAVSGVGAGGLPGAIGDIVDRFRNAGHGTAADSWVATGPNQPVTPQQTAGALGDDLIDALAKQTNLSREELLARLSQVLPQAVDQMTPGGKLGG